MVLFCAKGLLYEQEGLLANIFSSCARMRIVVLLTFYVFHLSHVSKSKNEIWTHGTGGTHVFGLTLPMKETLQLLTDEDRDMSLIDRCGHRLSAIVVYACALLSPAACVLRQVGRPLSDTSLGNWTDE